MDSILKGWENGIWIKSKNGKLPSPLFYIFSTHNNKTTTTHTQLHAGRTQNIAPEGEKFILKVSFNGQWNGVHGVA